MPISPTAYATPLQLDLQSSGPLSLVFVSAHLFALASLSQLSLHGAWLACLGLLILLSMLKVLTQHAWLVHPAAIVRLDWYQQDWVLELRNGRRLDAVLCNTSTRLGPLLVLNFKAGQERHSCIILPHRLPRQAYRRLCIRLKIQARKFTAAKRVVNS